MTTLFCNFCYNSGRGDFDTHTIRNREGKLTCKYLANICCTKCGEKGHTVRYCRTNNVFKPIAKDGEWIGVSGRSGIKKYARRSEPTLGVISNVLGGAFSALVIDDEENLTPCSPCSPSSPSSLDNDNHKKIVGNDGSTVTITWATKTSPIDLFSNKNKEKMSWADMVEV